ncbi:hypothetical protein ABZ319_26685 [Nocardia sp. NPDC005978]|uniref:hypothetical protein n=1 Tax=Nocardia sp. NPDC005978 TaxID=3156725 RepID=UPI0033BDB4FD
MSHELATQAVRSTRRAAQAVRYTAVVTAAMASIGLTVTAGAYIANQMAGVQHSDSILAGPPAPRDLTAASADRHPGGILPLAERTDIAALFENQRTVISNRDGVPSTQSAAAEEAPRPQSTALAGQLRLGNTYVGAQVLPVQRNSLTFTVDTNLFATLADLVLRGPIGEQLGVVGGNPSAVTQLRTDLDTRRGELTLTLSDPAIGAHGLQLARHPAPAATATDELTAAVPVPPGTSGQDAALGHHDAREGSPDAPDGTAV